MSLHVTAYQRLRLPGMKSLDGRGGFIAKFTVYLKDRPGSLASLSSLVARHKGNIGFFHYDRSVDASRVAVEVQFETKKALGELVKALKTKNALFAGPKKAKDGVEIVSLENILEIKVRLVDRPGTLAAFARLLKQHKANMIYMLFDGDIDADSADVAVATKSPEEVDFLLGVLNSKGYRYRVVYRGAEEEKFSRVIGLKQVEKFFLRLKDLIADADAEEIRALVGSSQDLHSDLVRFYHEAGNDLEAGDVFENVLALASIAASRTGKRFTATGMLPLQLSGRVKLHGFRLPTSESVYVFTHDGEITLIDSGYGLYYEDVKSLLRGLSLDPARVRRVFVTHPDADHIGAAGYFEEEFGTRVLMHKSSRGVMKNRNRGCGGDDRLRDLNKYFTRLVTRFTKCRYPENPRFFSHRKKGHLGDFAVIDSFRVGDLEFDVLESKGGHILGQVFFLNREHGLCFTSDFLIDTRTLSAEDRKFLRINRDLLVSVNRDSNVFRDEMASLQNLIADVDKDLRKRGKCALVFPGHGNYYSLD